MNKGNGAAANLGFRYALLAGLAIFHFYVFILILSPRVSDEYSDYYITGASGLSPMQRRNLTPIEVGDVLRHDTPMLGFDSWSAAETDYRWSLGEEPKVFFLLADTPAVDAADQLTLGFSTLGEQRVQIYLNERSLLEGTYGGENVFLQIPVPSDVLQAGENVLRFELPDAHRPGNGDGRILGLALKSFSVN